MGARVLEEKPRLRVLQVYKDYYPPVFGGMEKHINELSQGLVARGIAVDVLVSNTLPKVETYRDGCIEITKVPEFGRIQSAPVNPTLWIHLRSIARDVDILSINYIVSALDTLGTNDIPIAGSKELDIISNCLKDFESSIETSQGNILLKDI